MEEESKWEGSTPFLGLEKSDVSFEKREKRVPKRYHRLLDLFSLFLVVYFFTLSWILPAEVGKSFITLIGKYFPQIVVNKLLFPVFISFLWIFVISQERERLTRALFIFDGLVSRLSFFQKAFYGINIIVAMLFFILPLASIGITFFLIFYLPYLAACKVNRSKELTLLIFFVFFFLLGAMAFFSLPRLAILLAKGWLQELFSIWIAPSSVSIIYDLSLSIGAAGSISSFILFIYQGAHEYDQSIKIPHFKINLLEAVLSVIFSFIIFYVSLFPSSLYSIVLIVFSILLFMYSLERFLRWVKGLKSEERNTLGRASSFLFLLLSLIGIGASRFVLKLFQKLGIPCYPGIFKIGSMLSATIILLLSFLIALGKASLDESKSALT